jgi:hypothetical protein
MAGDMMDLHTVNSTSVARAASRPAKEISSPNGSEVNGLPLIAAAIVGSAVAAGGDGSGLKNALSGGNLSLIEASISRISVE